LPGYGGSRILLDAALTGHFDETRPLLIGSAWLLVLALTVAFAYRRTSRPAREHHRPAATTRRATPEPTPAH